MSTCKYIQVEYHILVSIRIRTIRSGPNFTGRTALQNPRPLHRSPQSTSTRATRSPLIRQTWRSHGRHQVLRKVLRYLIPTIRLTLISYNRYLAITARVVRRSLKEQPRLQAERRGEMDLRFAKWTVSRWIQTVQIGDRWINSWLCRMASKARSKVWQAPTQRRWQMELGRHSSKVLIFLVVGWAGNCTYWWCTLRGGPVGKRSYY